MSGRVEYTEAVKSRFRRGSYELRLKLDTLKREDILETEVFKIGGFQWRLVVCRCFDEMLSPETIEMHLHSCNAMGVKANVTLTFINQMDAKRNQSSGRKLAECSPFDFIKIHCANYNRIQDPSEGFLSQGILFMAVTLKHIKIVTGCIRRTLGEDMRIIHIGLFSRHSITSRMDDGELFGLVSKTKIRTTIYTANLLIRPFLEYAVRHSDWRFWLCDQSLDGTLSIKRCLNEADSSEAFGDVCNEWDDRHGRITMFLEDKKDSEELQTISNGTIIVFCKLYEPEFSAVRYLGHLLVDKTTSCFLLLTTIAQMAELSNDRDHSFYVEEGCFRIREILRTQSSLVESGFYSGSVVIVRPQEAKKDVSVESIRQAPCHQRASETSQENFDNDRSHSLLKTGASPSKIQVCSLLDGAPSGSLDRKRDPTDEEVETIALEDDSTTKNTETRTNPPAQLTGTSLDAKQREAIESDSGKAQMSKLEYSGKVVKQGHKCGNYELVLKIDSLNKDDIFETPNFEVGGLKWILALYRSLKESMPPEKVEMCLYSCNAKEVRAHVELAFLNRRDERNNQSTNREELTASPFGLVTHHHIDCHVLLDPDRGFLSEGRAAVTVKLKDVRVVTTYILHAMKREMRFINILLFGRRAIISRLQKDKAFGLASKTNIRSVVERDNRCILHWVEQEPHRRYWLCRRSHNGMLFIKRCLNMADRSEYFRDICNEWKGSHGWITIFYEQKEDDEEFQPIDDDTLIIFCKLYDPSFNDVAYLGHLLVKKTMTCSDLLNSIAATVKLSNDMEYNLYIEHAPFDIRDITGSESTLAESEFCSGSIVILRPREVNEDVSTESVQQALLSIHEVSEAGEDISISGSDYGREKTCESQGDPPRFGDTEATHDEICAANLMSVITIERFITHADASEMVKDRVCTEAVTKKDDTLDDPVWLLVVGQVYRLRVRVRHKHRHQTEVQKISKVIVKAPDGEEVSMDIEELSEASNGLEVVALLDPSSLKSKRFSHVSPRIGTLEERCIMMDVMVVVEIEEAGQTREVTLTGRIACHMIAHESRPARKKLARWIGEKRERASEWMKYARKRVALLAEIVQSSLSADTASVFN